jgi:hypothetical protein
VLEEEAAREKALPEKATIDSGVSVAVVAVGDSKMEM